MKDFNGIEFASEHNGTDVFRVIELAYEQGRKDGHSEQLGTNLAEDGTDLISRAAVQTELQLSARRYTVAHEAHGEGRVVWSENLISVSDAMDVLRKIPPAQPEIIRCKDCKHWVPGYITDNDDFIPPKCGEWQQMVGHSSDDYCSLAERREVQDENDKTTNNTTNA